MICGLRAAQGMVPVAPELRVEDEEGYLRHVVPEGYKQGGVMPVTGEDIPRA